MRPPATAGFFVGWREIHSSNRQTFRTRFSVAEQSSDKPDSGEPEDPASDLSLSRYVAQEIEALKANVRSRKDVEDPPAGEDDDSPHSTEE